MFCVDSFVEYTGHISYGCHLVDPGPRSPKVLCKCLTYDFVAKLMMDIPIKYRIFHSRKRNSQKAFPDKTKTCKLFLQGQTVRNKSNTLCILHCTTIVLCALWTHSIYI